jgi:osmotically-inducible protein OsmY
VRSADLHLKDHVEDQLALDPVVNAAAIGVSTKDAVVTLHGYVDSFSERNAAEEIVMNIHGVRALVNELEVRLPANSERLDEDIARTAASILLWHSAIPEDRIKIEVSSGWITLRGEVDWHYQRVAAERSVRDLMGVRGVSNQITVVNKALKLEIRDRIHEALKRNAMMNARGVKVELVENKAILSGTVQTLQRRAEAEQAAWNVPGITKVENKIRVA